MTVLMYRTFYFMKCLMTKYGPPYVRKTNSRMVRVMMYKSHISGLSKKENIDYPLQKLLYNGIKSEGELTIHVPR
jgi:hypothetical protein